MTLSQIRRELGLSQFALESLTGIMRSRLQVIESGARTATKEELEIIEASLKEYLNTKAKALLSMKTNISTALRRLDGAKARNIDNV